MLCIVHRGFNLSLTAFQLLLKHFFLEFVHHYLKTESFGLPYGAPFQPESDMLSQRDIFKKSYLSWGCCEEFQGYW